MPVHRVTQLRPMLDERGAPTGPERELATWLGSLVECVTSTTRDESWFPAPVACRACAPADYRVIAVRHVGPGVEWLCPACRASGTLMGWEGSVFDLSEHADPASEVTHTVPLFARLDELTWVRPHAKDVGLRFVLASARVEREHVVLVVDEKELSALLACAERAAREGSGKERNALERLVGRCDAVLALLERESGTGANVLH